MLPKLIDCHHVNVSIIYFHNKNLFLAQSEIKLKSFAISYTAVLNKIRDNKVINDVWKTFLPFSSCSETFHLIPLWLFVNKVHTGKEIHFVLTKQSFSSYISVATGGTIILLLIAGHSLRFVSYAICQCTCHLLRYIINIEYHRYLKQ